MANPYVESIREWWDETPKRWWKMILGVSANISLLAGVIAVSVWARHISPPLPWWNVALIIGGGLLFSFISFLSFHRVRMQREEAREQIQQLKSQLLKLSSADKIEEPLLKIRGQVERVEPFDYYAAAVGDGEMGDIKVLVKAAFNPMEQSIPIAQFALEVAGKEIKTEFPPKEVSKGDSWEGYFRVPKTLQIKNISARLFARVGDTRYYSPEFPIPFKSVGEEKL